MGHLRLVAPDIHKGDAVGNHCLELVRIFNSKGRSAVAYAERHSNGVSDLTQFFLDLEPEDIIIVSFSIYDPLLIELSNFKNYKICYFHGITPPKYLREHDPVTAGYCQLGLNQRFLLNNFDRVICNSSETAESLLGFVDRNKLFFLPPITQNILSNTNNTSYVRNIFSNPIKIITLGRVVPHKGIEECVLLIKLLNQVGVNATLDLVGSLGPASYINHIKELSKQLCVEDQIIFYGYVDQAQKSMLLKGSDLFFSASFHEGFGIPILEAMGYGLPIIVRATAIPKDIAKHCLTYSTVEQAARRINKFFSNNKNNHQIKNLEFYNLMFKKYSDESIFEFFQTEIFS